MSFEKINCTITKAHPVRVDCILSDFNNGYNNFHVFDMKTYPLISNDQIEWDLSNL